MSASGLKNGVFGELGGAVHTFLAECVKRPHLPSVLKNGQKGGGGWSGAHFFEKVCTNPHSDFWPKSELGGAVHTFFSVLGRFWGQNRRFWSILGQNRSRQPGAAGLGFAAWWPPATRLPRPLLALRAKRLVNFHGREGDGTSSRLLVSLVGNRWDTIGLPRSILGQIGPFLGHFWAKSIEGGDFGPKRGLFWAFLGPFRGLRALRWSKKGPKGPFLGSFWGLLGL